MNGLRTVLLTVAAALALCVAAHGALIVNEVDPWDNVIAPTAAPAAPNVNVIDVHAARNEYESVALSVYNDADDTVYLEASVSPGDGELTREQIVLREAVHIRNRSGALVADALPRLGAGEVLTIPAGEQRQIWLEIHTGDLPAGYHAFTVRLTEVGGPQAARVRARLHVWDFSLPDEMPLAVFNWDYEVRGRKGEALERYLRAMVEHGVNVFHLTGGPGVRCTAEGELLEEPDFSEWDYLIAAEKSHARMFLFETWQFRGRSFETPEGEEIEYLSEPWKRAFESWLTRFVEYTKRQGLAYEDWAFYPFDEYIGPKFVALGQEIRRIDPKILIFTDRVSTVEEVSAAEPCADIWCPYDGHFTEKHADALEIIMESGKPVWFYFCGRHQKAMPPLERYRLMGWKSFARGLEGCTYWNIFGARGSAWNDFDGQHPDAGSVYTAPGDEPVPSRRWEAFREGLEDYCYLAILQQRVEDAPAGTNTARARRLLGSAPEHVLDDPATSELQHWRRRIAAAIVDLGREQQ